MITPENIKHLASLARMELRDGEAEALTTEMDSILGYVGQVKDVAGEVAVTGTPNAPMLRNVMRADEVTNVPRQYTEPILANAPAREGDWLKVKKILG